MKNSILISLVILTLMGCSSDKKGEMKKFVYDYEDVLNDEQEKRFNDLFQKHEKKTTNEIVLVTTDNYGDYETIGMYAQQFFDINELGKADRDNGIVIVFSEKNSEVWITSGKGIEKVFTTKISKSIIDSTMIPLFKLEDNFSGLWSGSKEIIEFLEIPANEIKPE
ncbi:MAG: TPM domain-containing protein [Bacteroidales bacterium]|nr:TPM domain-containing protein [Bacteroidales bacterium]